MVETMRAKEDEVKTDDCLVCAHPVPCPDHAPRRMLARKTVACTVTVCDACGQAACWEGEFMCDQSRTAGTTEQRTVGYRCQFCGTTSPVRQWRRGGEECPKCKRIYDAVLAQDDP